MGRAKARQGSEKGRLMVTKPYIEAVERSIGKAVKDFQNLAFNFNSESDLRSWLFSYLRREKTLRARCAQHTIHLAHAEFPVLWKNEEVSGYYDLVVWQPQSFARLDGDALNALWGAKRADQARQIRVLVAIEIKHLYGAAKLKPLSSDTRITEHNDMKKLLSGQNRYCYFLAFCDEDIKEKTGCQTRFEAMRLGFERVREEEGSRFRVLCASKDGCEIKLGFSTV